MTTNEQARDVLSKGLGRHLFDCLWRSVLFTVLFSLSTYLRRPKSFDWELTLELFVVGFIMFSIISFIGLLLASARYRKR